LPRSDRKYTQPTSSRASGGSGARALGATVACTLGARRRVRWRLALVLQKDGDVMLTTRKLSAISFGVTALAGAALLAAGCINSFRADGDSKPAPAPGAGIQAAGCPDLCTPGPLEVVGSSASVAQFRPTVNRLRIEVVGDIVSSGASLQSLGACA